jgi:hypothetical protein
VTRSGFSSKSLAVKGRLEHEAFRDRLEVQVFAWGRDADHRRPPPDVKLIELAGHIGAFADPGLGAGEPLGLGPAWLRDH